jgi:UDP-N-acetylglucosamine--dolichyl-phosphate N-acetylglucosaminephosphotransferase
LIQIPAIAISAILPLLITYFSTAYLIKKLTAKGWVAMDYHKPDKPNIPRPGGPAIIFAILISMVILYAITLNNGILAIAMATLSGFIVGIVDDLRTLSGSLKPIFMIAGGLPIILLGAYSPYFTFPLFGAARISLIYILLILFAIPVTANTVNTIDVLNGAVSGFVILTSIPVIFALLLKQEFVIAASAITLFSAAAGFFMHHKFPSKIFPGDSGTLAFGAMYGAIVIVGGVELVGVVAILPAIMNSFFYLSSVRRFTEHRKIKVRPTVVLEDGRLVAERDPKAPITLVRLIVADAPMSEKEIVQNIFKLTAYSSLLAIIVAILTWVRL